MEFVTTNGIVAGEPTSAYERAWLTVVPIDGAMAGGMSGEGPLTKTETSLELMWVSPFNR